MSESSSYLIWSNGSQESPRERSKTVLRRSTMSYQKRPERNRISSDDHLRRTTATTTRKRKSTFLEKLSKFKNSALGGRKRTTVVRATCHCDDLDSIFHKTFCLKRGESIRTSDSHTNTHSDTYSHRLASGDLGKEDSGRSEPHELPLPLGLHNSPPPVLRQPIQEGKVQRQKPHQFEDNRSQVLPESKENKQNKTKHTKTSYRVFKEFDKPGYVITPTRSHQITPESVKKKPEGIPIPSNTTHSAHTNDKIAPVRQIHSCYPESQPHDHSHATTKSVPWTGKEVKTDMTFYSVKKIEICLKETATYQLNRSKAGGTPVLTIHRDIHPEIHEVKPRQEGKATPERTTPNVQRIFF